MQTPITYPGPGCIVEFLLGNTPIMAIVLEDQSGKLRLYTQQKRETKLAANRLLPWSGPQYGASLSRAEMDTLLETHKALRAQHMQTLAPTELWELAEGEVPRGSALWFAGLQWAKPDMDQVAAMGHVLLATKTHFRFTPPDFEVYDKEQVERRITETEATRVRDILAGKGHALFQALWQAYCTQGAAQTPGHTSRQIPEPPLDYTSCQTRPKSQEQPPSRLAQTPHLPSQAAKLAPEEPGQDVTETLKSLLLQRIADPDTQDNDALWKLLTKDLPVHSHLPLLLAQAWGLVPEHHNFLLDRAAYASGEAWADEYADIIDTLITDTKECTASLIAAATSTADSTTADSTASTASTASAADSTTAATDSTTADSTASAADSTTAATDSTTADSTASTADSTTAATDSTTADSTASTASAAATLPPQALCSLSFASLPFVSIDAKSTRDRDDAFHVEPLSDGSFTVTLALACPALCWPFGSAFDKVVQRRSTSLYLPDGTEHMLPARAGWQLFSLDAGQPRPALVLSMTVAADGTCTSATPCVAAVSLCSNLFFDDCQQVLEAFVAQETSEKSFRITAESSTATKPDILFDDEQLFLAEFEAKLEAHPGAQPGLASKEPDASLTGASSQGLDPANPATNHTGMLTAALNLARLLQAVRLAAGAVITERPDPEVVLTRTESEGQVYTCTEVITPPQAELAHLVVGELMILANTTFAKWGLDRDIPLLYKTQDVALPREFTGVWSTPHEIYRVVRSLPSSSLETRPRRHAGLGVTAYTTATSPIRRYADLLNQGQIIHYLLHGLPRLNHEELALLMPFLQAQSEAAIQIQRYRPRYWKLVFFLQQGDKKWWKGVVVDANAGFVTVALPWIQLILRGKRKLFDEKTYPGQPVEMRIGKINPLLNEITVLETKNDAE